MTEINPQLTEFTQQKNIYLQEKQKLDDLTTEKQKTENVIQALHNEIEELMQKSKESLTQQNGLSMETFIELKQENAGLKARLEYYQATIEEFDCKIDAQKEKIFFTFNQLKTMRSAIIYPQAITALEQLIARNKEKLSEIYRYFELSDEFTPAPYSDESAEDRAKAFITNQIKQAINTDFTIDEQYSIPRFIHQDEIKSPMKKHQESFDNTPKGFQKLIHNL
ncbi:hypothetical protein MB831_06570 [Pasteurella multocida subsp. multocida]|uniref:Uncharacterized protein n=2 Tax=Gammaproteobacteria TaxID=1236 RepID=A0A849CG50_PASMD|nr:hypothetical protein [Pasteurella multocida]AFI45448.1 hypothetical protein NT08PM_0295 [Pasteurella multocida subsp. multocida str. 3480]AWW54631.1 hypothetical protein DID83_09115 [Pasteurella multocida]EPE72438.1 hypothetical protein H364_02848 [Pasteurella multocida 671/90]MCH1906340.1 hypothetical protein [Pasteurella multocida]MCL7773153.1 hypothetical protein [Pasteurella multocida]